MKILFCINYNVKLKLSKYDIKDYLKQYSKILIWFLVLFFIGIILAIFVANSDDGYLKLLTKENKILYQVINGEYVGGKVFWKKLLSLLSPMIIIFILHLNYYFSYFSFFVIAYQGMVLTLTIFAVVSTYGISGVLNSLFLILPINIIYIAILIYFSAICFYRSKVAKGQKNFLYNIKDNGFLMGTIMSVLFVILLSFFVSVIVPQILKSAIFIIF